MADETRQPQPKPPLGPLNRGIRDRLRRLSVGHVLTVYDLAALHDLLDMEALAQANEPRAIIRHFAAAMERKLAANDGTKGGWRDVNYIYLMDGLNHELDELYHALAMWRQATETSQPTRVELTQDVLDECADVANFAMLVADVCGALPPTDERGR